MRKLANGWFFPPPLELGFSLPLLLLLPPQAAPRRANPATSAATLSNHVHRWLRLTRYLPIWTFPPRVEAKRLRGVGCYPAPPIRCDDDRWPLLGLEAHECTSFRAQIVRLGLLENTVDSIPLRRVEDAA